MIFITSTHDDEAWESLRNTGELLHFTQLIAIDELIAYTYIHHESFKFYVVLSHLITDMKYYT
jgi:hypothetical protein